MLLEYTIYNILHKDWLGASTYQLPQNPVSSKKCRDKLMKLPVNKIKIGFTIYIYITVNRLNIKHKIQ